MGRGGIMGEKVQGIRSIIGRYKADRGRVRIVWEMEKSKNLYVRPWTGTKGWVDAGGRGSAGQTGIKGRKYGTTLIAQSIKNIF